MREQMIEEGRSDDLPECRLTGVDGNVFVIIGTVSRCLKRAKMPARAKEFESRAMFECKSYDEALQLCFQYVDVI